MGTNDSFVKKNKMLVIWKTLFSFSHEYFHKLNLKIGCTGVQYEIVEE